MTAKASLFGTDNRTGVAIAPDRTKAVLEDVRSFEPRAPGDTGVGAALRLQFRSEALPLGGMSPMVAPEKHTSSVFLDKLGERLAFERGGARLYELLMIKLDGEDAFVDCPRRAELERIRSEELDHFAMLSQTIGSCGGDPTALTPSADLALIETSGLFAVLSDPRTTLVDGLHAMLVAELVDGEAWQELIDLAHDLGYEHLLPRLGRAHAQERDHLAHLRAWVSAGMQARIAI